MYHRCTECDISLKVRFTFFQVCLNTDKSLCTLKELSAAVNVPLVHAGRESIPSQSNFSVRDREQSPSPSSPEKQLYR